MERGVLLKTADYLKQLAIGQEVIADPSEDTVEALENRLDAAVANAGGIPKETIPEAEMDAEGLPWDVRIHSSSRALNVDGTWRVKRNLDKDVLAKVRAELLATAVPEAPPSDPAVFATPPPPETTGPPAPPAPETTGPPAPEAAASVPTPAGPTADLPQNYGALVSFITAAGTKLAPFDIVDACKQCGATVSLGVTNLPELAKAGDDGVPFIPLIAKALQDIWAARG